MKVKDLIEKLQGFDPELMVVRPFYEGGVTEVLEVTETMLALYVNAECYYGEHSEVSNTTDWPDHKHAQGVHLT
jgi:hypothetical protein